MEVARKISDLTKTDRVVLERLLGQALNPMAEIVLIVKSAGPAPASVVASDDRDDIPNWCSALEGLSDEELAAFDAALAVPVRLVQRDMSNPPS